MARKDAGVLFDSLADLDRFPVEFGKARTAAKLPPEAAGMVARTKSGHSLSAPN